MATAAGPGRDFALPPPETRGRRQAWLWGSVALLMLVILAFVARRQVELRRDAGRVAETTARANAVAAAPAARPRPSGSPH